MSTSHHKHAPWRKSVLIPFWTIQLLFELLMIAALALAVDVVTYYDEYDDIKNRKGFNTYFSLHACYECVTDTFIALLEFGSDYQRSA